ncbi:cupin domain-containing protein [Rubellimicrobium arenae]|uniref:cupin domain-containing protein n=1 Tax=Rubellimicrobium arenae TaxID=2817372 RepID=UPI001B3104E7|nr:cupin domain-containing protein [Rubellimicrobium arenae]
MNAISHDFPVPSLPAAMARDLMGAAMFPTPSIRYHTMLSSHDTGALSVLDSTTPAEACIPPHVHDDRDELCVILSGILEFRMAGRILRRRAGESIFIPRGIEHEVRAVTEARHIALLSRTSLMDQGPA